MKWVCGKRDVRLGEVPQWKRVKWVNGKRGVMGGSSSEIWEEGEMGLWKEEYTLTLN